MYIVYIRSLGVCYDFETQPFGFSESSSQGLQDFKRLYGSLYKKNRAF